MRHLFFKFAGTSLLSILMMFAGLTNAEEPKQSAKTIPYSSKKLPNFQISSPHRSVIYSCNLISASGQCREYELLKSAKDKLAELTDACGSMGAEFKQVECPKEKYVASCVDIVRNYHRPDVIYTNHYYRGGKTKWDETSINRVCSDLGGEMETM